MSAYEKPMIHVVPEQKVFLWQAVIKLSVALAERKQIPALIPVRPVLNPAVRLLSLPKAHSVLIITDVLTICRKSSRTSDADNYFGIFTSYNS